MLLVSFNIPAIADVILSSRYLVCEIMDKEIEGPLSFVQLLNSFGSMREAPL